MELKAKLQELLDLSRQEEQAFQANLTQEERVVQGSFENWSPKDILAHITTWKELMGQRMRAAALGETPPRFDNVDEINAQTYPENAQLTWPALMERAERACTELIASLQAFSDEDLSDPQRYAWQDGRPLWQAPVGDGFSHPMAHLAHFYAGRGQRERADQLQEMVAQKLAGLDDSPRWQGVTRYNLACYYALSGQKDKAIAGLREALRLNPGLKEWSHQDMDFASIREDPQFQAVYLE